jgi:hypothetical protein
MEAGKFDNTILTRISFTFFLPAIEVRTAEYIILFKVEDTAAQKAEEIKIALKKIHEASIQKVFLKVMF